MPETQSPLTSQKNHSSQNEASEIEQVKPATFVVQELSAAALCPGVVSSVVSEVEVEKAAGAIQVDLSGDTQKDCTQTEAKPADVATSTATEAVAAVESTFETAASSVEAATFETATVALDGIVNESVTGKLDSDAAGVKHACEDNQDETAKAPKTE